MNKNTTQDLAKLSFNEIDRLADLLKAYVCQESGDSCKLYGDSDIKWEYNPKSDNMFLIDKYLNAVTINYRTGKLERLHFCSTCGFEGFKNDFTFNPSIYGLLCPKCKANNVIVFENT